MHVNITFKNMDATEPLKDYVTKRLSKMDKYIDRPTEASVVLSVEKIRHKAEVTINADRHKINAIEETEDMYSSIDLVMDKLERQIKKHKEKVQSHKGGPKSSAEPIEAEISPAPRIVRETAYDVKPMSVEEAAMQMDVTGRTFLIFQNTDSDSMNILYRRDDGDIGLVEPTV